MKNPVAHLLEVIRCNMLRTRLILGLMSLLVILLAVGLYSIRSCTSLGASIEEVFEQNYFSIQSMQSIQLAVARLNAAVVMKMSGESAEAARTYRTNLKILKDSLDVQKDNVTSSGEDELTEKLERQVADYAGESRHFFNLPAAQKTVPRDMVADLSPIAVGIADTARRIQDLNQQEIETKRESAKITAKETIRFLLLAMIVAIVVALYASYRLGRGILLPIDAVTSSIREIGKGNLDQKVPVFSRDELGELAETVNLMAGQLRSFRESQTEKIIRMHKMMETTLASFPDPIFVFAKDGEKVELRNPAAEKFAWELALEGDHRLPEVIGKTVKEVLAGRKDYLTDKLKDALHFKVGGEDHFYLLRVLILLNEKDEVFGAAVVLEDVTKLRLVDDMKGSLVSTVSHELKTPLTGLRLAVHLLLGKMVGPLNEKQEQLLTTARDDSERLLRTLNNLLDLARLEESKTKLELEEMKLEEAIEVSIEHVREIASSHHQKVTLEMEPHLPPVMLDRQRIGHIFTNLLTNALKHSQDGAEIMVKAGRKDEESIRVRVIDHGMGIPQEHAQRIFERFYRVPGQTKSGAGLGLSIAREIARAHGGEVGVTSEEGKGSEFYVDLPVVSPGGKAAADSIAKQSKQPTQGDSV